MRSLLISLALCTAISCFSHEPAWCDVTRHSGQSACAKSLYTLIAENQFNTKRDILFYLSRFASDFGTKLTSLGPGGHWIDAGAGDIFAAESFLVEGPVQKENLIRLHAKWHPLNKEYGKDLDKICQKLNRKKLSQKPQVTAISYKTERTVPTFNGQLRILTGRYLEEIPLSEIGKADIITDFYGVFAYSPKIDEVIRRYVELLKDDGSAYIWFEEMTHGSWTGNIAQSKVIKQNGQELMLIDWIEQIPGIEVRHLHRETYTKPGIKKFPYDTLVTLQIKKNASKELSIPKLELISADTSTPPLRIFKEVP